MRLPNPRPALFLAFALLVVPFGAVGAATTGEVVTSPIDHRDYAHLVLDNGLRVLLVSDPEADKAAASLDVNVGSGSDPIDRPGLAHFLEHMLFLGTERYPDPGEYKDFITRHGGSNNAYTAFDHTNYFFDVDAAFLEPALDRFAQFFVAPLFDEASLANEREVVHSEYQSMLKDDGRRVHDARREALNPGHPAATFAVGSRETLADRDGRSIREEVLEFYRHHYSAELMSLVVLGREPLAVLEEWVAERFTGVPATGAERLSIEVPLHAPGSLPARLDVVPVREQRNLSFSFPIPPVEADWRSKPTRLIATLVGDEGPGSLHSLLRARGWVEHLSAGVGYSHRSEATFNVSLSLTEAGVEQTDEIGALLFRHLDLVREAGIEAWRYEEQARLAELAFRYEETPEPLRFVRRLADALHYYPVAEVLRAPYALDEFEPERIRDYLGYLRSDNVFVTRVAPDLETDSVSRWYETQYRLRPIPAQTLATWEAGETPVELALPGPNPFVPEDLALLPEEADGPHPARLEHAPGFELWHHQDTSFRVPRANLNVSVRSPVANDDPRHAVLTELYVEMVEDTLNEFAYPAAQAGLRYRLYRHLRGFTLQVGGYSDRQDRLLERLVEALSRPELDASRFELRREELMRRLRNRAEEPPHRRSLGEVRHLLLDPHWSAEELLEAAGPLGIEDLEAFVPKLLAELELVALAHGNVDEAEARRLAGIVREGIAGGARPVSVPRAGVTRLPAGERWLRRIDHRQPESAAVAYFQGASRSDTDRALAMLTAQIVSSPFFEELRTERRLGYVVFATHMPLLEVPGIAFVTQSSTADPGEIEAEVERFLADFLQGLSGLDDAALDRHREAVVVRLLRRDANLAERTDRWWQEIDRDEHDFATRERLVAAVRAIDRQALEEHFRRALVGEERRMLVVHAPASVHAQGSVAGGEEGDADRLIEDPRTFKDGRDLIAD